MRLILFLSLILLLFGFGVVSAQGPVFTGTSASLVTASVVSVSSVPVSARSVGSDWLRLGFSWVDYPCRDLIPAVFIPSVSVPLVGVSPSISLSAVSVCPKVFDVDFRFFGWRVPLVGLMLVFAVTALVRWLRQ